MTLKRIKSVLCLVALCFVGACVDPTVPVLDVRSQLDDSRPAEGEDCKAAGGLSVSADQVVHLVHALPTELDSAPGELEITVTTGCTTTSLSVKHDADGLALVPITLPAGAECGAVISAVIANAADQCVLQGVLESSNPCVVTCPEESEDNGESTGDGDGDPTTGDGDGDPTTGDGDGDPTTGDGDPTGG